jgi:P-type Cu2+ transporter
MDVPISGCWHCAEPLPGAGAPRAVIGGQTRAFCCFGCSAAAQWIDALGLADYYRLRTAAALRVADRPDPTHAPVKEPAPALARLVVRKLDASRSEMMMLIEGMHCSACAWLIERAVGSIPGVDSVHVNIGARRARVIWHDSGCSLAQILDVVARTGYRGLPLDAAALDDAQRDESRTAFKRLAVAGFGAMQAMMYSSALYFGVYVGIDGSTRSLFRWLGLLVATPVVFYSARPFFSGARRALAARHLTMDVPVASAIASIYAASLFEAVRGGGQVYFDSVSMFVFFLLLGRFCEMRARHRSCDLSDALVRAMPMLAERYRADGSIEPVAVVDIRVGDRVHVAEGGAVPADGLMLNSSCLVDESMMSGESAPLAKRRGDALLAGSMVVRGLAEVKVARVGGETSLAGIISMATRAATERPRLSLAGDRAAAALVARVLVLAGITAAGWAFVDPARAFNATLAVLVVSCPCAFALAVPAALTRALAVLAKRGVLVVRPDAIEKLAAATHVLFDKTGTLTVPVLNIERTTALRPGEATAVVELAAALARGSRHPIARAIAAAAVLPGCRVDDLRVSNGEGIEGTIAGRRLRLGRKDFADPHGNHQRLPDDAVVLADDSGVIASFALTDTIRSGAREVIDALHAAKLRVELVSGDAAVKVRSVAASLGIERWYARQRPDDKLSRLAECRTTDAIVVAVGDGINDAPLLAGADVAVTVAAGADIAQATSDIVLVGERLDGLIEARSIACDTLEVLRQNQRWALFYNCAAMPIAALGFVPPWAAAIGMSVSSLIVILNALRIGRDP